MNNNTNPGSGAPLHNQAPQPASTPYMQGDNAHFNSFQPNNRPSVNGGGASGNPGDPNKKKSVKVPIIIAVICVIIVGAIGFGIWWFQGGGSDFYDSAAQEGQAPYKTQEEIIAELNRVVEEGMLNISIASLIEFENGTSEGTAYIENVPSNRYVLRVVITLDSTGEVVYQSGGIKPDSYIENIRLSTDLPAGTYPATATFIAYDPDTLEEVGQALAKITLSVAD